MAGISVLGALFLQTEVHAQFTDWVLNGSGSWTNSSNWSGNVPGNPLSPEIARIDLGTAQVTSPGAATYFGLIVGNNSAGALQVLNGGTLFSGPNAFFLTPDVILGSGVGSSADVLISGTGSIWTVSVDFYMGWNGSATMTIANGGRLDSTAAANAGFGSSGTATINVSGAGSIWNSTAALNLGADGTADLTVGAGGQFSSTSDVTLGGGATGDGSVTVSGSGARWDATGPVIAGSAGNGDLTVNSGGVADFSSAGLVLAESGGSTATLDVSGAGSAVDTGDLVLADDGDADLTLGGGATLDSGTVAIADGVGSDATAHISGSGTTWTAGATSVGKRGTAVVTVDSAAALTTGATVVGAGGSSDGTLTIDGAGTAWDAGDVTIADAGTATFNLSNGAIANATGALVMGAATGASGAANISGASEWTVNGTAQIGDLGTGTLAIAGGSTVSFDQSTVLGVQGTGVGNATVGGIDSAWSTGDLTLASDGTSTVAVSAGGTLVGDAVLIGALSGSDGELSVTGAGSSFTFDSLVIGSHGAGTLTLDAGASGNVSAGSFVIGSGLTGTGDATIDGTGTSLFTQGATVADQGSGGLLMSGGALVNSAGTAVLANGAGAIADVEVRDADTLWQVTGALTVGGGGDATLAVDSGATLRALGGVSAAKGATSSGAISVDGVGSEFRTTGNLDLGFSSGRNASLTVDGGLAYVTESVLIGSGGDVFLNGGELSVGELVRASGGGVSWTSGQLTVRGAGGLGIGSSGPLGASVSVSGAAGQFLDVTQQLAVDPAAQLIVSGDALAAGGIVNNGIASFNGGTVTVGGSGFTNNALAAFDNATVDGDYTNSASAITSVANTVTFNGATGGGGAFDWPSGTVEITGAGGLTIGTNGLMGDSLSIDAANGQFLDVTGNLTVDSAADLALAGNALSAGGIVNNGQISFDGSVFSVGGGGGFANNGQLYVTDSTLGGTVTNNAGATTDVTGTVVFDNGGGAGSSFDWVSGTVRVNSAGGLLVSNTGLLGAAFTVDASGGQALDVTNTLTIASGGDLMLTGDALTAGGIVNSGQIGVDGGTVTVGAGGFTNNNQASFNNATIDGDFTNAPGATSSIAGTVTFNSATGGGGAFDWPSGTVNVGGAGGLLIGTNGLMGDSVSIDAANGQFLDVTGNLTIESGADLAVAGNALTAGGIVNNGQIGVDGGTVTVGAGGFTNNNQASFNNATIDGDFTNAPGATSSIAGTVTFNSAIGSGGVFDWPSGTVNVAGAGGLLIGTNGLMGDSLSIDAANGQFLDVTGNLTVDPAADLAVAGNALSAGGVVNNGQVSFDGSTFSVGAGGFANNGQLYVTDSTLGGTVSNNTGATTDVTGTVVFDNGGGAGSSFDWVSGTVRVNSAGGLLVSNTGLLGAAFTVDASGGQALDVTNTLTVASGGNLMLTGDALTAGGIVNNGQIGVDGGTVTVGAGGFTNNNQASFNNATIDGDYSNPGGSTTAIGGTVAFDGALGGGGSFTGSGLAQVNGAHTPGDSPARVEIDGDLAYGGTSSATFELGGTVSGLEYDVVAVGGDVSLAGTLGVEIINGFALVPGMNFRIIEVGGNLTGSFSGLGEGSTVGNFTGEDLFISYAGGDGNDVALYTATPPPVPEPGAAALFVLGAALTGLRRRRAL